VLGITYEIQVALLGYIALMGRREAAGR